MRERIQTDEQKTNTKCMNLLGAVTGTSDRTGLWIKAKQYCDTYGPDEVIEYCISEVGFHIEQRCFLELGLGAVIYQLNFGSGSILEREFYARQWLLSDILHGNIGALADAFESLDSKATCNLAMFARFLSHFSIGLTRIGQDGMFTLATFYHRAHQALLDEGLYTDNSKPICDEVFRLTNRCDRSISALIGNLFYDTSDAVDLILSIVAIYPLDEFFQRPSVNNLYNFLDEITDDLSSDDIELLEIRREMLSTGLNLSPEIFPDMPEEAGDQFYDLEEKLSLMLSFIDYCLEKLKIE